MTFSKLKRYPWYTILFAVYPTITLLAHNIGEVEYEVAYRALLVSSLVSMSLVILLYIVFRNLQKTSVLTTLLLFGFFYYGHVFGYVRGWEINGLIIGRHTYFIVIWLGLWLVIAWGILRSNKVTALLSSFLSAVAIFLLVIPVFQLVSYQFRIWQNSRQVSPPEISIPLQGAEPHPDIYYIVLDMYGRNDLLLNDFGYDNSDFLQNLKGMGFYVAECSQSNYFSTTFSLSSTLNLNYLPALSDQFVPENKNTTLMWHLIQSNGLVNSLKDLGYQIVAFETGYRWTELRDADYYYKLRSKGINDFESLLLKNSLVSVFFEKGLTDRFQLTSDQRKHDLSIYVLDELENVPSIESPKFVFAHLTIPHPPFVIGPGGELEIVPLRYEGNESYYLRDEYAIGYINQVKYLNSRLPQVLKSILEGSENPPIIIIQGDHGPRFVDIEKQVDIINAYYLPDSVPDMYPSISPVNSFRMIINAYFGANLPILPDQSYWSMFETPYEFIELPNECVLDAEN